MVLIYYRIFVYIKTQNIMIVDYRPYALFDYEQNQCQDDEFVLGSVVINEEKEIGVIIQCHGNDEYRTDMFGNCSYGGKYGNIEQATWLQILLYRAELLD